MDEEVKLYTGVGAPTQPTVTILDSTQRNVKYAFPAADVVTINDTDAKRVKIIIPMESFPLSKQFNILLTSGYLSQIGDERVFGGFPLYNWAFRTQGTTRPTIVSSFPANRDVMHVENFTYVDLQFSERVVIGESAYIYVEDLTQHHPTYTNTYASISNYVNLHQAQIQYLDFYTIRVPVQNYVSRMIKASDYHIRLPLDSFRSLTGNSLRASYIQFTTSTGEKEVDISPQYIFPANNSVSSGRVVFSIYFLGGLHLWTNASEYIYFHNSADDTLLAKVSLNSSDSSNSLLTISGAYIFTRTGVLPVFPENTTVRVHIPDGAIHTNRTRLGERLSFNPSKTGFSWQFDVTSDPDDCLSNLCALDSTCVEGAWQYTCDCPPMVIGTECDSFLGRVVNDTVSLSGGPGTTTISPTTNRSIITMDSPRGAFNVTFQVYVPSQLNSSIFNQAIFGTERCYISGSNGEQYCYVASYGYSQHLEAKSLAHEEPDKWEITAYFREENYDRYGRFGVGLSHASKYLIDPLHPNRRPRYFRLVESLSTSDVLSFPTSTVVAGSLRRVADEGEHDNGSVDSLTNSGEQVQFRLQHSRDHGYVEKIHLGPEDDPQKYVCSDHTLFWDEDLELFLVQCFTEPFGRGKNLRFSIFLNNIYTEQSIDTYSYPSSPSISQVTGCGAIDPALPQGTAGCPTTGGVKIMIVGEEFIGEVQVSIGNSFCTEVEHISSTTVSYPCSCVCFVFLVRSVWLCLPLPAALALVPLSQPHIPVCLFFISNLLFCVSSFLPQIRCVLPPGSGRSQSVSVTVVRDFRLLYSKPEPLLSYTPPSIVSVTGCGVGKDNLQTINCRRTGGDILTILGQNFGPSGATILIGGEDCLNVIHRGTPNDDFDRENHESLTCVLNEGFGLEKGVIVLQRNGQASSSNLAKVSFTSCEPGTFEDGVACTSCPRGTFTAFKGLKKCKECPVGTYSTSEKQTKCVECEAGRYQQLTGQFDCLSCKPGSYATQSGLSLCVECPSGSYSNTDKATSCVQCYNGQFQNATGNTRCDDCSLGKYTTTTPASNAYCLECEPGTIANLDRNTCQECPTGTFQKERGKAECQLCPPGRFAPTAETSECVACGKGTFQSMYGQSTCSSCPQHTYQPEAGNHTCLRCPYPLFTLGNNEFECLGCRIGQYAVFVNKDGTNDQFGDGSSYRVPKNNDNPCVPCPDNAICDGGSDPEPETGFYLYKKQETGTYSSFECLPGRCLSSEECGSGRAKNIEGNENLLCGRCISGYYEWGGECVECKGTRWEILMIGYLVMFGFLYIIYRIAQSTSGDAKIFFYFVQIAVLFMGEGSVEFLQWLEFFNFNVFKSAGNTCISDIDQSTRMLLAFAIPMALTVQLGVVYVLHRALYATGHEYFMRGPSDDSPVMDSSKDENANVSRLMSKRNETFRALVMGHVQQDGNVEVEGKWAFYPSGYLRTLIVIYLFTFTGMIKAVLEFFDCISVGEAVVVRMYPAVSCESADYKLMIGPAVVCFLVLTAAIPGFLFYKVRQAYNLGTISTGPVRKVYGVLFESFGDKFYYWEFVILMRRMVLVCVAVFLIEWRVSKLAITSLLNALVTIVHVQVEPFYSNMDNLWAFFSLSCLTAYILILSMMSEPYGDGEKVGITLLILVPGLAIFGYTIRATLYRLQQSAESKFSLHHGKNHRNKGQNNLGGGRGGRGRGRGDGDGPSHSDDELSSVSSVEGRVKMSSSTAHMGREDGSYRTSNSDIMYGVEMSSIRGSVSSTAPLPLPDLESTGPSTEEIRQRALEKAKNRRGKVQPGFESSRTGRISKRLTATEAAKSKPSGSASVSSLRSSSSRRRLKAPSHRRVLDLKPPDESQQGMFNMASQGHRK